MRITRHELRLGRISFLIWTCAIAFLLGITVWLFPEMKGEMEDMGSIFSSMGSFTAMFGLDRLNFGTLKGYYAIECGNIAGIGGALFASLLASGILSKEEKEKTAEFLFAHPVSRLRIMIEKLLAVLIQITVMNAVLFLTALFVMRLIGEEIPFREVTLMHLAYYLMQVELGCICFFLSAFLRKGSTGAGVGVAAAAYTLNLIANIADKAAFLKDITPFGYCEGADIINDLALNGKRLGLGLGAGALCVLLACLYYPRKDLR